MKLTGKIGLAVVVSLIITLVGLTAVVYGNEGGKKQMAPPEAPDKLLRRTAEILSVSEEKLLGALNQAYVELATERLEKLVEEEWLGEKRAEIMKERIEGLSTLEKARTLKFFICRMGPTRGSGGMRHHPGTFPRRPRR